MSSNLYALDFTYYGHRETIWQITNDGNYLYSVGADGMLKVWDRDLTVVQSIPTHNSWTRCIDVNEKYIAVGGYKPDNLVKIYDKFSGKLLYSLKGHSGSVFTIKFYGEYLISAGSDNSIIIWKNFSIYKILKVHDGWVRSLVVFNGYIVSGDESGKVNVIDFSKLNLVKSINLKSQILSMTLSENSVLIGTSSGELYELKTNLNLSLISTFPNSIYAIDTSKNYIFVNQLGKIFVFEKRVKGKNTYLQVFNNFDVSPSEITSVTFFNGVLYCGDRHGEIFAYTVDGKYISKSFRYYSSVLLDGDENLLYVGRESGIVEAFEKKTARKIWQVEVDGAVRSLKVFTNTIGNSLIVSTSNGKLYILKEGRTVQYFETKDAVISLSVGKNTIFIGTYEGVYAYRFGRLEKIINIPGMWVTALCAVGDYLFIGTNTGYVYMLVKPLDQRNLDNSQLKMIENLKSSIVNIICCMPKINKNSEALSLVSIFSFSGKLLIIQGNSKKILAAPNRPIYDGTFICSENIGTINKIVYAGDSLSLLNFIDFSTVFSISFEVPVVAVHLFPSTLIGNLTNIPFFIGLANGRVLEVVNGKVTRQFASELGKISALYAEEVVISGHEDGKVAVWQLDKRTGKYNVIKILADHFESIRDIAMYKDKIITSSSDRTIKIWDLESGKLLKTLSSHNGYVWAIHTFDDKLVSGDWDGKIIIWDLVKFEKIKEYSINSSITDIWATSVKKVNQLRDANEYVIYVSTLEGYIFRITSASIEKEKLCNGTLWTIDGKIDKNGNIDIYTAGWDGNVYVLSSNLKLKNTFKGHNSTIFKIVLYNDYLISAGSDNILKVWDSNFRKINEYANFKQSVLTIAISKKTGVLFTTDGLNVISVSLSSILNR
ncbi:MAG: hypothetical protein ACK4R7_00865 [Fervidobacterium sp.]